MSEDRYEYYNSLTPDELAKLDKWQRATAVKYRNYGRDAFASWGAKGGKRKVKKGYAKKPSLAYKNALKRWGIKDWKHLIEE